MLTSWKENYDQPRQHIKKQRHYFANQIPSSQGYGFSSNHVWMWELNYKESWVSKNRCFWTVVLEKTLESPLDWKEIQPVHPKGNQPWIFIGRTGAEAEAPIFWPPDGKKEYWSGLPFPSPGNFLTQGSNPGLTHCRQTLYHLSNLITWTIALCNSMKPWAVWCRATQEGQVMVENSDKTWSTGEGNGKPLQYSCLENPMNNSC